jgi:hypothetical protein
LAVLRFTTISNLVGNCTGRSPGLTPVLALGSSPQSGGEPAAPTGRLNARLPAQPSCEGSDGRQQRPRST